MAEVIKPQIGAGFFADMGSEDMDTLKALNEIIANSIDSWIEEGCGKKAERPQLNIEIEIEGKDISIRDNAGGMNKEEMLNAMGLGVAQKAESKCAEDLMGMYGFGLKAAASGLGKHFEVVSKRKNEPLCHVIMPIEKMKSENEWLCEIEEDDFHSKSKIDNDTLPKTVKATKSYSGTYIYIKDRVKKSEDLTPFFNELSISWKYFTQKNKFGKAVKISFNGKALRKPTLGHKNGIVPYSPVEIELPIEWKENSKTFKEVVKGEFWINWTGGQYGAGGTTTYRRLQLIQIRDQQIGDWWSNEASPIEGFIHSNYLTPNQRKDDLKRSTAHYKALNRALKDLVPYGMTDGQTGGFGNGYKWRAGRRKKELSEDELYELNRFLATVWIPYFQNHQGLTNAIELPRELKKFEKELPPTDGGPTDGGPDDGGPDDGGPDDGGPDDGGPDDGAKEEIFQPINDAKFIFRGEEWTIISVAAPLDKKMYAYKIDRANNIIEINIHTDFEGANEEIKNLLIKFAGDTMPRGNGDKLAKRLMVQNVIENFLIREEIPKAKSSMYAQDWLQNLYKS